MTSFSVGCGRGGLQVNGYSEGDGITCLPGSGHGGKISYTDKQDVLLDFAVGEAYGQEDLTTVEGGSGGDFTLSLCLSFFCLFFYVFLIGLPRRCSKLAEIVATVCVNETGQKHPRLSNQKRTAI